MAELKCINVSQTTISLKLDGIQSGVSYGHDRTIVFHCGGNVRNADISKTYTKTYVNCAFDGLKPGTSYACYATFTDSHGTTYRFPTTGFLSAKTTAANPDASARLIVHYVAETQITFRLDGITPGTTYGESRTFYINVAGKSVSAMIPSTSSRSYAEFPISDLQPGVTYKAYVTCSYGGIIYRWPSSGTVSATTIALPFIIHTPTISPKSFKAKESFKITWTYDGVPDGKYWLLYYNNKNILSSAKLSKSIRVSSKSTTFSFGKDEWEDSGTWYFWVVCSDVESPTSGKASGSVSISIAPQESLLSLFDGEKWHEDCQLYIFDGERWVLGDLTLFDGEWV